MRKPMKFLFCGFGNIMQRHFRNLKKLLPKCEISVYTHRYDKHRIFDNNLNVTYTEDLYASYAIEEVYYNVDGALAADDYDAVIIGTLPPDRIDIAIKAANRGLDLFIEKPLSIDMNYTTLLERIVTDKGLKCVIGFQMRQHPVLKQVKKMLNNYELGSIYRIEITHSSDLKNWSKGRNSDFYALNKENGGGVIFSQIHELDYLNWLMCDSFYPKYVDGNFVKDIDNNVAILGNICYSHEEYIIPTIVNLDFLGNITIRDMRIFGNKKTILADLIAGTIFDYKTGSSKLYHFEWNDLFLNEMKGFIKLLKDDYRGDNIGSLANIAHGINTLETALEIKKIINKGD